MYRGVSTVKRLQRAEDVLERVGLKDRQYFMPKALSGGQVQRAAIARALVGDPQIIIADEPTGNLDSAASLIVMELLSELHRTGNTIIMVTHNPEITRYADRVVYMHDGCIVHDQRTPVGEVPALAKKAMYVYPRKTEEDDLAGVSAMMEFRPDKPSTKKRKTKTRAKKRKVVKAKRSKDA
jgi:putative ABC transport system ATP-binding protein